MNSPIAQSLTQARQQGRAAFIPFLTGGFPDYATSMALLRALDQGGADVIEVGIPFSDPLADGPTIQFSSKLALDAGATPQGVLAAIAGAMDGRRAPVVVMTYYNPVLNMGLETFAGQCRSAGVAGVIIPDLPPEEAGPWLAAARARDLDTIFMAAPTTPPQRRQCIFQDCRGFLYYVSMTGVTGSQLAMDQSMLEAIQEIRRASPLPVAVGFGVATAQQAAMLAGVADGVIVGSALVRQLLEASDPEAGVAAALALAQEIRGGLQIKK